MSEKSKNKIKKPNKNQERTDNKKNILDFPEETVSHGSKVQKDLHRKFFFGGS